jgi:hypothetical protein
LAYSGFNASVRGANSPGREKLRPVFGWRKKMRAGYNLFFVFISDSLELDLTRYSDAVFSAAHTRPDLWGFTKLYADLFIFSRFSTISS